MRIVSRLIVLFAVTKAVVSVDLKDMNIPPLLQRLLPEDKGHTRQEEQNRYIVIEKAGAGMSNSMLSLASGIALAMVTQRTPLFDWSGSIFKTMFEK